MPIIKMIFIPINKNSGFDPDKKNHGTIQVLVKVVLPIETLTIYIPEATEQERQFMLILLQIVLPAILTPAGLKSSTLKVEL